ncbi:MAG: class I adenylate-forming enzyme family protein [Candidatus Binatia bacterium]
MLYQALVERAERHPSKIAVTGQTRSVSFKQLLVEVRRTAAALRRLGVRAEQPILVGVPPSPDFYVIFYAACALGATVIPLLPSGKIPQPALDIDPVLAVGENSFLQAVKSLMPGLRHAIRWDRSRGFYLPKTNRAAFAHDRVIRGKRILGILTSGTTGEPTIHFTTAEALVRHGRLRAKVIGIREDDVLLSTRPFNNMSSIDAPVILPMVSGCKVVVREQFKRFEAAETISRERVTIVYGVPVIFEMLASIPANYPGDFSSLRLGVSGGAPLSRFIFDKFYQRFGLKLQQRYGNTQFFPAFNFDTRGIPGAVGQTSGPFPMTVVDEGGKRVTDGGIGEIVIDLGELKTGFWRSALEDSPDRRGNHIHTGDLGKLDSDDNLFIVGRKSRFIKVGGNRVAPAEVESVIRSNPKVRDTIVFPYHPGERDEAVHAVVVPTGRLTPHELLAFCAERLDPYKCPRRIDFCKNLPRNAQGKIVRYHFESERASSHV